MPETIAGISDPNVRVETLNMWDGKDQLTHRIAEFNLEIRDCHLSGRLADSDYLKSLLVDDIDGLIDRFVRARFLRSDIPRDTASTIRASIAIRAGSLNVWVMVWTLTGSVFAFFTKYEEMKKGVKLFKNDLLALAPEIKKAVQKIEGQFTKIEEAEEIDLASPEEIDLAALERFQDSFSTVLTDEDKKAGFEPVTLHDKTRRVNAVMRILGPSDRILKCRGSGGKVYYTPECYAYEKALPGIGPRWIRLVGSYSDGEKICEDDLIDPQAAIITAKRLMKSETRGEGGYRIVRVVPNDLFSLKACGSWEDESRIEQT